LASPLATVERMVQMLRTASFWENARETGYALLCALALALAGGIGLGVALGLRRLAAAVAEPILITLYSIPKVTLYPLVLLTFGLGISAKVAFGVMHGLIPIAIFAMNAIRQMKPVYLRSSRVLRLSSLQTATSIVVPAILPELLSGVRIGFSLTLLGVLIGEMFASRHGLGFLITNAMGLGDMATIMAVALFLTAFALAVNAMFSSLGRLTHR
jgi:NitT/TauT family transport system permease protein